VYVETYGCWLSKGEGEIAKTIIEKNKGVVVDNIVNADVVVIHTCAVRGDTERKMLSRIRELAEFCKARGIKLVVTGCLVNVRPATISRIAPSASLIEPGYLDELWSVIISKERKIFVRSYKWGRSVLPSYKEGVRYVVPIQSGCLGNCAFCIEPIARGKLHSYPPDLIVEKIAEAVGKGAKEIYLTGQDVICYGLDMGVTLPELIDKILRKVEGEYLIRIGMLEPSLTARFIDELLELMKDERVYKYLHLPLQSGSNKVLKLMNRKYSVEEYLDIAGKARRAMPDINITTDIIVGFPGESEEDFEETVEALKSIRPDKTHIARYTIRPFTVAATMKQVPEPVKKKRSKILSEIAAKIAHERNLRHVGRLEKVLINSLGRDSCFLGRTLNYKPVLVSRGEKIEIGVIRTFRIESATPIYLRAAFKP